ncbi:hypothetical protein EJ02DRAFT_477950 [Clathrospora elynae]|uniref:Uncharacterized protein n=1 Tax=Clathrospora elynae TaxID=706981 RepID=A0A6A5SYP9_9PLEO|nr:hypothetical protein EJ02DRAFT_477950 [Clathrospora elynae]
MSQTPRLAVVFSAEYGYLCIPIEMTGQGKMGFFSGFHTVNKVLDYPPTYFIVINDTDPMFFYCSAPGSCLTYGMMLNPGEPFPAGFSLQSITPASAGDIGDMNGKQGLSGGAIAGIVILAALLFFWVRTKSQKDEVDRKASTVRRTSPNNAIFESSRSPPPPTSGAVMGPGPRSSPEYGNNPVPTYFSSPQPVVCTEGVNALRQDSSTSTESMELRDGAAGMPYPPKLVSLNHKAWPTPPTPRPPWSRRQRMEVDGAGGVPSMHITARNNLNNKNSLLRVPWGSILRTRRNLLTRLPPHRHYCYRSIRRVCQDNPLGGTFELSPDGYARTYTLPASPQSVAQDAKPAPSYFEKVYRPGLRHVNEQVGPVEIDGTPAVASGVPDASLTSSSSFVFSTEKGDREGERGEESRERAKWEEVDGDGRIV